MHQSHVLVDADHDKQGLKRLRIEFHGELSRIPSLKNSKLPGRNFINPDVLQRLKAMDGLFQRGAEPYRRKGLAFGDAEVLGVLVCPKRKVRFDLDNCAAAIKDWCEPPTKRLRGWGVGLVNDDSRLNVVVVRAEHVGLDIKHSLLILRRWSDVDRSFCQWFTEVTG